MAISGFFFDLRRRSVFRACWSVGTLFLRHDPKRPTQSSGYGSMFPKVLGKPRLDIDCGADIMAARRSLEDVNPRHKDLPEGRIELPTKGL